ncbi:hypothetical protein [Butyrivibrio sp. AE3004]|uniref:hypothetical protein n=1 Tax=Butyrivibrio sp. AE3004 TaxID=1506994 RepID=UPI000AD73D80|nr:hypothetical protein [Butyrivibrio sp. AE3004]
MMLVITSSDAFEPISIRISPRDMEMGDDVAIVLRESCDAIQGRLINDEGEGATDGRLV